MKVSETIDLFGKPHVVRAPNVASVPQYSPFRFPGGKTWLYPFVKRWLTSQSQRPHLLIEPFAGGASVSLATVIEDLVDSALMVEIDSSITVVWQVIISEDAEHLVKRISSFEITEKNVEEVLNEEHDSLLEKAFASLLRNRISHGGITAPGAGWIKHGEEGKGLRSRWYPRTLCDRIRTIASVKDRLQIMEGDGFAVLSKYSNHENVVFFIDPPYTVAGKRLYNYFDIDHERLFEIASNLKGDYLITYDESEDIISLARNHQMDIDKVLMQTTHHWDKYELLIGRDVKWLRK